MSRKRPTVPADRKPAPVSETSVPWRDAALVSIAALLIAIFLYFPAIHGPFIFDDNVLNIRLGERDEPIISALRTRRPVLSVSYWLDYQWTGDDPAGYREVNLAIHAVNTGLIFLVLFRLLEFAGWSRSKRRIAALVGAAVFLVHPLQTESVAYIAGRSESLAALFMLLAFAVFLYRPPGGISWPRAATVLLLTGIAGAAKENAVAVGGLFLLTDLFWGPEAGWKSIRSNWRLYAPAAALGVVGVALVARVLANSVSAGFAGTGIKWYQYGLTESRAILTYVRMAVLPYGQSVDHDFAVSQTPLEHAAILSTMLVAGLALLAWFGRRRWMVAGFGFLLFLVLLAPTSSVIPISDPLVERRMYLPLLGLILMACDVLGRRRIPQAGTVIAATLLVVLALTARERNRLWGNPEQMWISASSLSQHKARPYLHLTELLMSQNRCSEAMPYLEHAQQSMPDDEVLQVGIARVLECLGRRDEALARLQQAAAAKPSSRIYQWVGLLQGAMGRSAEAGAALQKSVALGPLNSEAHSALGLWYESVGQKDAAIAEYKRTVELNQYNAEARTGLMRLTGKSR
jgi:Flp pilus assembly protein TadD